jgi:hypothetical protein
LTGIGRQQKRGTGNRKQTPYKRKMPQSNNAIGWIAKQPKGNPSGSFPPSSTTTTEKSATMNNCPTTTMTTTPSPQIVVDTEQQQAQFFSSAEDILLSNTITPNLDLHTFCTHWGATRPAQAVCQAHAMSVIVHAIVTSSDTIHQQALALRSARLYSMRWMR